MTSELSIIRRDWNSPIRESRSSLENPETPLSYPAEWLLDAFNGGRTDSGVRVSELTAFQTSTFLACVDLIAGKIAALPRHVYERKLAASGRAIHRIAYEHDYYDLVNLEPNDEMSGNTSLKAFLCHCLAWGKGFAELQRDAGNNVVAIWPRNPDKTQPRRLSAGIRLEPEPWRPFPVNLPAGTLVYQTTDGIDDQDGSETGARSQPARIIPAADMLHVPGMSFDGRIGQSVVHLARQTLGLALATEKFGAKYFANFARPGGILEMPMNLKPEDKEQSKRSWQEAQGGENSSRVAVMPPGFKWIATSNNPEEAQANETRKFIRHEICAIMHVPPHMVGAEDSGKSTTEQRAQELKEYCLDPWISGIRMEYKRKLFPHRGVGRTPRSPYYMDFDLSEMLRPDAASREKFYASGRQWSYLNGNDIRAMEKLNPIEDDAVGEAYWMPVNMTLATTPVDPTHQDGAGNGEVPGEESPPKPAAKKTAKEPLALAYSRLFHDALNRVVGSKKRDSRDFLNHLSPVLFAIRDMLKADAEREFHCEVAATDESDKFLAEYLGSMHKRSPGWAAESVGAVVGPELERAIRSIRITVFREVATARAKEAVA